MPRISIICFVALVIVLGGCKTMPPFDEEPSQFASDSELAKRDAARKVQCNKNPVTPIVRIPALMPSSSIRTGKVSFVFDLDDAGTPTNVRIRKATEELFIPNTLRSLETWKYTARSPAEPLSKRKNLCSSQTFKLTDERGRVIPTWEDVKQRNKSYQKYKNYLANN